MFQYPMPSGTLIRYSAPQRAGAWPRESVSRVTLPIARDDGAGDLNFLRNCFWGNNLHKPCHKMPRSEKGRRAHAAGLLEDEESPLLTQKTVREDYSSRPWGLFCMATYSATEGLALVHRYVTQPLTNHTGPKSPFFFGSHTCFVDMSGFKCYSPPFLAHFGQRQQLPSRSSAGDGVQYTNPAQADP